MALAVTFTLRAFEPSHAREEIAVIATEIEKGSELVIFYATAGRLPTTYYLPPKQACHTQRPYHWQLLLSRASLIA